MDLRLVSTVPNKGNKPGTFGNRTHIFDLSLGSHMPGDLEDFERNLRKNLNQQINQNQVEDGDNVLLRDTYSDGEQPWTITRAGIVTSVLVSVCASHGLNAGVYITERQQFMTVHRSTRDTAASPTWFDTEGNAVAANTANGKPGTQHASDQNQPRAHAADNQG